MGSETIDSQASSRQRGERRSPADPALVTVSSIPLTREQREFEARIEEHRGIVFKIAASYCPDGGEREDLVQEICLQLWRSYPRYDPRRRFSTWMYRVALNTAISFARTRRVRERRVVPLEDSEAAETAETPRRQDRDERIAQLNRFLYGLAGLDRALVVLYLEERSYREISEVLGISETNVGTKLGRLKQRMRRELAADEETDNGPR